MRPQSPAAMSAELLRCRELEYILCGDLREMLGEPMTPVTRVWTLAVLDALLDMLPTEQRLLSNGGYLSEVLDEFPNWSGRVNKLRSRRYDLYDRLSDLRDVLESTGNTPTDVETLKSDLRDWMEQFADQCRQESALLLEAVNTEIGGG